MFLKNKNIIFKIRRSKVTDYAALTFVELSVYIVSVFVSVYGRNIYFYHYVNSNESLTS